MKKYERPYITVESFSESDIIRTSADVTTEDIDIEWGSTEYYDVYGQK